MVVERREAQRARSRRFAQADRSVARATPEAWAGGNIRPRGVAHDPGASRRSTRNARGFSCEWLFVRVFFRELGFGKTRARRRRENAILFHLAPLRGESVGVLRTPFLKQRTPIRRIGYVSESERG